MDNYAALTISSDSTGVSNATVPIDTFTTGNYFVSVQVSPANRGLAIGCGNVAAPTA
jgi:hypothetical protein